MHRVRQPSFSQTLTFQFLKFSPSWAGVLLIGVAALVLVGWIFDITWLKSLQPEWVSMKVNTAIAFLAAGTALNLTHQAQVSPRVRSLARGLAIFVALVGLLTLGQYLLGLNLGIDQLLIPDAPGAQQTSHPGRMAPNTATNFLLAGMALFLSATRPDQFPRWANWVQASACIISIIAIQALMGYSYIAHFFAGIASYTYMALHTAVLFLVLAWGLLCSHLNQGLMELITSDRISGIMARRLLSTAIGIPLLSWWLILQGSELKLFPPAFGLSLLAVTNILILTVLIWQNLRLLERIETRRERAEQAFGERDAQLQLALDAAHLGTWDWDLQTQKIRWSSSQEHLFGLQPNTFTGNLETFLSYVHPDDRQFVAQETQRALQQQNHYAVEFRVIWPDQSVHWIAGQGRCLYDQSGQPVRMLGVCMDITERNEAEEGLQKAHADLETLVEERTAALSAANAALRQQMAERQQAQQTLYQREQELSALLENAPDVIIRCDRQLRYVYVNPAVERTTGLPAPAFLGKTSREMGSPPELADLWEQTMQQVFATGEEQLIEFMAPSLEGWQHYQSRVVPEFDQVGTVQYALIVSRDITALKQAEAERTQLVQEQAARAEAEATNRMKDEFLAVLSHELRTPLNAILGWARLLRTRTFDGLTVNRALDTIERNAEAQAQLIEDILDVSRIIQGKLSLNLYPVSLRSVLDSALDAVRPNAEAKSIDLVTSFDPSQDTVPADPKRLQQIFWNVLTNAVKFTPPGGRVTVQVSYPLEALATLDGTSPARCAQITVQDTGKGISPEFLPYVFDRFRQADSSTTRAYGGLGLGLAIVHHLVELHGGTVTASSTGEGQGATFTIQLPLEAGIRLTPETLTASSLPGSPSPASSPEFHSPLALEGLQVLVVDDDADSREFVSALLAQAGAQVGTADSGAAALRTLGEFSPDVILTDIGMPEQDGYDLLREIQALQRHPPIPVIAVTAYARDTDRQQALMAGFASYLCKPVRPEQLIAAIAHLALTQIRHWDGEDLALPAPVAEEAL